ncbi:Glycine-rich RNA-binding protein [Melia azedarach]|uniref:Glycine-rich RNA-binding protein n=1 Tax=Melia azedarach TaxID=155640 RepID=A0ACC1YS49_MELAZ|nr:Glycine-rich RNA-binding protein [Melia azedarach]
MVQWLNGRVCHPQTLRFTRWLSTGNTRTKLFIGGLSYDTNETVLKGAFGQHGDIVEAVKVVCDRVSGKSRGYGFVKYTSEAGASAAIKDMDGQLLDGRNIRVHYAYQG